MAEANQAYHKRNLSSEVTARIPAVTGSEMTLARYYAKQAVKAQWRAAGLKLQDFKTSELAQAANDYLDNHPELIAFATERYRNLVASGRLRPPRKLKLCST
jgi:hypothetical protein